MFITTKTGDHIFHIVARITYTVLVVTSNHAQSINRSINQSHISRE